MRDPNHKNTHKQGVPRGGDIASRKVIQNGNQGHGHVSHKDNINAPFKHPNFDEHFKTHGATHSAVDKNEPEEES